MIIVFADCSGMLKLKAIKPVRQHSNQLSTLFARSSVRRSTLRWHLS